MCGSGARWCARADAIFDVPDMHVLDVEIDDQQRLVLTIESGQTEAACPACGVTAVGHGRRLRVRTAVPDDDFQRDPRCGVAPNGADNPGGCVGNQRAQLRRHHRLGAGRQMCSSTPRVFTPLSRSGLLVRALASTSIASQAVCQSRQNRGRSSRHHHRGSVP